MFPRCITLITAGSSPAASNCSRKKGRRCCVVSFVHAWSKLHQSSVFCGSGESRFVSLTIHGASHAGRDRYKAVTNIRPRAMSFFRRWQAYRYAVLRYRLFLRHRCKISKSRHACWHDHTLTALATVYNNIGEPLTVVSSK